MDEPKTSVISKEMRSVRRLLKKVPEERKAIAQSLYNELVFMQNTLATLKEQIEAEGATAMFKQGKQEFLREHPALKAYNTTVQRYSLLYKQLVDLLPPAETEEKEDDPLMEFIKK